MVSGESPEHTRPGLSETVRALARIEAGMKTFTTPAAIVVAISAPALAQAGIIHGNDSRGEPFNSSYRASGVDPATGYTIGHTGLTPGLRYGGRGYARARMRWY
jgi:hypothetical protein